MFHVSDGKTKLSGGQSTSHHNHPQFTLATWGTLISLLATQILANGKFARTSAFKQAIALSAKICFQQPTIQKFDPLLSSSFFFFKLGQVAVPVAPSVYSIKIKYILCLKHTL